MVNILKGKIINYRRGRHTQTTNQMIIVFDNIKTKEEAEKLINKKVTWVSPGDKKISGKITSTHGNKGAVRVLFERGMPGQAIGSSVELTD